jgi:hypothetical protein
MDSNGRNGDIALQYLHKQNLGPAKMGDRLAARKCIRVGPVAAGSEDAAAAPVFWREDQRAAAPAFLHQEHALAGCLRVEQTVGFFGLKSRSTL